MIPLKNQLQLNSYQQVLKMQHEKIQLRFYSVKLTLVTEINELNSETKPGSPPCLLGISVKVITANKMFTGLIRIYCQHNTCQTAQVKAIAMSIKIISMSHYPTSNHHDQTSHYI